MATILKQITQDEIAQITSLIKRGDTSEVNARISVLNLQDYFTLKLRDNSYCVGYELKNLAIKITSNANFLQIKHLANSDIDTFSVSIKDCRIHANKTNQNNYLYFNNICVDSAYSHKWNTQVHIENTVIENVSLFFQVKSFVSLVNVTGSIDTLGFKPLFILKDPNTNKIIEDKLGKFEVIGKNLLIDNFNVHQNVQILKINNVTINKTTLGDLYQPQDQDQVLHTLEFDMSSDILDQSVARSVFKRLRLLSKQLDDRIQAHIFYVKELKSYSKDASVRGDDKWLIILNSFVNDNGTSFIKPIILLFTSNIIFLALIFFIEGTALAAYYDFRNVVLPTHSILLQDQSYSGLTYVLDAARRVFNSVLIFSAVSAALRLRFK
jgi:hypothetical protein